MGEENTLRASHEGLTPKQARDTRARALRYALDRYLAKQKAIKPSDDEDGKPEPHDPVDPEDA